MHLCVKMLNRLLAKLQMVHGASCQQRSKHNSSLRVPLDFILLFLVSSSTVALGSVTVQQIGPGIAGQLHAVAIDPVDPSVIYVGGDNCGVFRSENYGETWERYNRGMMSSDSRKSSYVDDLVVVPAGDGVAPAAAGVYAATHGGIYLRPSLYPTMWYLQTSDDQYYYHEGFASGSGAAIPFCSLAFDDHEYELYAGAGTARFDSHDFDDWYPVEGVSTHYSLWKRSLASSTDWEPVTGLGNVGRIVQIGVLENSAGTSNRIVVASDSGVYLEPVSGSTWIQLWTPGSMNMVCDINDAQDTFGVGVGRNGHIYVLTRDNMGDTTLGPGVWELTPSGSSGNYSYSPSVPGSWEELDDPQPGTDYVLPQGQLTWQGMIHSPDHIGDLTTLTVVAGNETTADEVFVGMEAGGAYDSQQAVPKAYNGYFRHGVLPDGSRRWVNILFDQKPQNNYALGADHRWVDYDVDPTVSIDIPDFGWLDNYIVGSTVPFAVAPSDHSYRFASQYHMPMVFDVEAATPAWVQRYCTTSAQGYATSTGISIMSARVVGFTENSHEMFMACGDFTGFVATGGGSDEFKYSDPYWASTKDSGRDMAVIGDDIYLLRGGPRNINGFGFDQCSQKTVIARYDENVVEFSGNGGGHWYYVSQGINNAMSGIVHEVKYIEKYSDTVLFAGVSTTDRCLVFRGERPAGGADWTWAKWWESPVGTSIRGLTVVPNTDKVLLAVNGEGYPYVLQELNALASSAGANPSFSPVPWITFSDVVQDYGSDHRLTKSMRNIGNVLCDKDGRWVYMISHGIKSSSEDPNQCANILRAPLTSSGAPGLDDWAMLLNDEDDQGNLWNGIDVPDANSNCWPTDTFIGVPYAEEENLPIIQTIAIHPDDPLRIYVGVRVAGYPPTETFHETNGVWEYNPYNEAQPWDQIWGGSGEPNKGVTALAFDPADPTRLIAGTHGQGYFQLTGIPRSEFTGVVYADRSSDTQMSFSGQPLNVTTIDVNRAAGKDLLMTRYDASSICFEGRADPAPSGAPIMDDETDVHFPNQTAPAMGSNGAIAADFDRDGWVDLLSLNASTGARLYRNNQGVDYEDVTVSCGLAGVLGSYDNVFGGAWADYDQDGYPDLALVSGDPEAMQGGLGVYRNNAGVFEGPVFPAVGPAGYSPLWADFTGDGLIDLVVLKSDAEPVVIPPDPYHNFFFINQGDGTFVDDAWNRLGPDSGTFGGTVAATVDIDNDGDFDIVYALERGWLWSLINDGAGYFSPGGIGHLDTTDWPTDLAVADYDRDGFADVMVGYGGQYGTTGPTSFHVFGNREYAGGARVFVDETSASGIAGTSHFSGFTAADFNRDGFSDVFLSRQSTQPFFYKGAENSEYLGNAWLGVRLESQHGANLGNGLGATVKIHYGTQSQMRMVDGGSGLGSQQDSELVFGLGSYRGAVVVEVRWPTGRTQHVQVNMPCQYVTVVDDSPVLDRSSIDFAREYHLLTGKVDWLFTWETYNACDPAFHKIVFDLTEVPGRCLPPHSVLTGQTSGVQITSLDLGDGKFEHTLELSGVTCEGGCRVPYTIECGVSEYRTDSVGEGNAVRIDSCIQAK